MTGWPHAQYLLSTWYQDENPRSVNGAPAGRNDSSASPIYLNKPAHPLDIYHNLACLDKEKPCRKASTNTGNVEA